MLYDAETQAEVVGIDWTAVDDLGCGIELEVSGDAQHQPVCTDGVDSKLHFHTFVFINHSWRRSRVGRTLVSAGELSLSFARLLAGRMITLWVRRPLSVSQHGQLSHPSLRGR